MKCNLINRRLNQRFRSIVYREIKRSSELSALKAKELSISISNEELESNELVQPSTQLDQPKSKFNSKYYIPRIELKDERSLDEPTNSLVQLESSLRPYLYSCVNANYDEQAFRTIEFYENRSQCISQLGPSSSLKLINILVKHYALKNDLNGIEKCLHFIQQINHQPDLVFYSYFLYALAKNGHRQQISTVMNLIQKKELNPSALFKNSYLNTEQRQFLIETFKKCDLHLNFNSSKELGYNTKLLDKYSNSRIDSFSPIEGIEFDENSFNQQLKNEKDIFVQMDSAYSVSKNQHFDHQIQILINDWTAKLKIALNNNLVTLKQQYENDHRINIHPFLESLNKDKLTKFLVFYLIELSKSKYPPEFNYLSFQVGSLLENQYLSMIKLRNSKHLKSIYRNYFNYISDPTKYAQMNSRLLCSRLFTDLDLFNREVNEMVWSGKTRKDVGTNIIQTCLDTLRFNTNALRPKSKAKLQPAFFKSVRFENNKRSDTISTNAQLYKITSNTTNQTFLSAKDLPMLVPPFPWHSADGFPFLISKLFLVIEPSTVYERRIAERMRNFNINALLDSLNFTSLTPWKINNDVLEIQMKIFQNGGDYKLDIPHHHTKMPDVPRKEPDENFSVYKKRVFELKKQNREMYSLWCEMNYKLSVANYIKDKLFWYPNYIDFRGRVYPTSIYLSQVSNDVGRSLLMFGKGKKLGEKGFDWLKIHLINLTGTKKSSTNQERLQYAESIMDDIIDSAEKPLDGRGWWKKSDDPWQTLACCIEINKVLKSGNPSEYVCHFPVHQDGSCNGLQHYAALGRDLDGARSVNLLPQDRPADVYSEVAALVEEKRKIDADNGDESAITLDGFINRKLVKATVMTNVYGVTNYGAKLQFKKVLSDVDSFPKERLNSCSNYLVRNVFNSIEDLFTCSKEIQDWLIAISIAISKRLNMPVEWCTPLGFPVVQYYYKKAQRIQVDSNRQRNGCPPNYIHSLDATHMMLTSLYCEKQGITFASVHDSFWTHPSNIEDLSKILRDQFVSLYSDDLLNDLSNYFLNVYRPHLVENSLLVDKTDLQILNLIKHVPNRGKFDINQVLKSKYFFS